MALSPDGRILASLSYDNTVRLWAVESGRLLHTLPHQESVACVAWSPYGRRLASGGGANNRKVTLWEVASGRRIRVLGGCDDRVTSVAWSPDGKWLASGEDRDEKVTLWETATGKLIRVLSGYPGSVYGIVWSPDGKRICFASSRDDLQLWDVERGEILRTLKGHTGTVTCIAWSPNNQHIASGSGDRTVRLWDVESGQCQMVLEGHTEWVISAAFLDAGRLLVTLSWGGRLILWRTDDGSEVMRVDRIGNTDPLSNFAVHPTLPILAAPGSSRGEINLWSIDFDLLRGTESTQSTVYVNAKAVLLGDSGVGKSGLGIRMADREFRETSSTHGAQFWHFPAGRLPGLPEHIQAELTLWDLAGQPEYRLTHQLFLDDVDVALLLFDCSDAGDPFRGVPYWAKVLRKHAPAHTRRFLVSSRADVSPVTVDRREINHALAEYGLDAHYKTSAATGEGVAELFGDLMAAIPWAELPRTSTPRLFQVVREFLLERKQVSASRQD